MMNLREQQHKGPPPPDLPLAGKATNLLASLGVLLHSSFGMR